MKKRGFTLIELLAVIVILAVIALIAVPLITKIIDNSKKNAALESQKLIIKNGALAYQAATMTKDGEPTISEIESNFKADGVTLTNHIATDKLGNSCVFSNADSSFKIECTNEKYTSLKESTTATMKTSDNNTGGTSSSTTTYNVGDTMCVTLDGFTTTNDHTAEGCTTGQFLLRVSNTTPCTTEQSQTACGTVLEFVDLITTYAMNSTNTNVGGWPASEMRTYINSDIYNALPNYLKSQIIDTTVVSSHGSTDTANFTSTDKLYLLSTKEVWGKEGTSNTIDYDTAEAETRQLDYYKNQGVTTSAYSGAIKYLNGTANRWWLRSAAGAFESESQPRCPLRSFNPTPKWENIAKGCESLMIYCYLCRVVSRIKALLFHSTKTGENHSIAKPLTAYYHSVTYKKKHQPTMLQNQG